MYSIRKLTEKDLSVFFQLWQFYECHNSYFSNEELDANGCYDVDSEYLMDVLLGKDGSCAYFLMNAGNIAGFVTTENTLVNEQEFKELSDIFVLPKYRKQRLAYFAIKELMLTQETGTWHVSVYKGDRLAQDFWEYVFKILPIFSYESVESSACEDFFEYIVINS